MLVLYDPLENIKFANIIEEIITCHCQVYSQDLMKALEYDDRELFQQALFAAKKACTALDIPVRHHFKSVFISREDAIVREYKLSSLACYFVTMNADPSHPTVARAQYYFIRNSKTIKDTYL
jgi:hypothetical protein